MSKEWKTEPWVLTKTVRDPALIVGVIAHVTQSPGAMAQQLCRAHLQAVRTRVSVGYSYSCNTGTGLSWLQLWLSCL